MGQTLGQGYEAYDVKREKEEGGNEKGEEGGEEEGEEGEKEKQRSLVNGNASGWFFFLCAVVIIAVKLLFDFFMLE